MLILFNGSLDLLQDSNLKRKIVKGGEDAERSKFWKRKKIKKEQN